MAHFFTIEYWNGTIQCVVAITLDAISTDQFHTEWLTFLSPCACYCSFSLRTNYFPSHHKIQIALRAQLLMISLSVNTVWRWNNETRTNFFFFAFRLYFTVYPNAINIRCVVFSRNPKKNSIPLSVFFFFTMLSHATHYFYQFVDTGFSQSLTLLNFFIFWSRTDRIEKREHYCSF